MTDRRYSDDEVAFILEQAARIDAALPDAAARPRTSPSGDSLSRGMSLEQVTGIAREAGIAPEAVTLAARAVARGDQVPTERHHLLGLPIGVTRTIEFSRAVSDAEWERMVVALRDTFAAAGTVNQFGSLRQWRNGNLRALLEPTPTGHRLRLMTRKGEATGMIPAGLALTGFAGALGLFMGMSPAGLGTSWGVPAMVAAMGLAAVLIPAVRLPGWARTRAAQMEAFGERATAILEDTARSTAGVAPAREQARLSTQQPPDE